MFTPNESRLSNKRIGFIVCKSVRPGLYSYAFTFIPPVQYSAGALLCTVIYIILQLISLLD